MKEKDLTKEKPEDYISNSQDLLSDIKKERNLKFILISFYIILLVVAIIVV